MKSTLKPIPKLISKTKIMRGYQCVKSFYLSIHNKELEPKVGPELQALFDQGNQVTEFARQHYSKKYADALLVENTPWDFSGALKRTKDLLNQKSKVIFEAAFEYKGCFARVDMIIYNEQSERWHVCEVKSTTKVKDEHLDDLGLQAWILANAGLPIEKLSIIHINNLCTFPDLDQLFTEVDVTEKLRETYPQVSVKLNQIFPHLKSESIPFVDLGAHCMKPNPCVFYDLCFQEKNIPQDSIFEIPTLKEKKWDLYQKRMIDLYDPRLLETDDLNEKQKYFLEILKNKSRYIHHDEVQKALLTWTKPLIFLDFETISFAIPKYPGTRPFQQVPFQFSVHYLKDLNLKENLIDNLTENSAVTEHFECLETEDFDPRRKVALKLIEVFDKLPQESSVVAYYSKFESGCLQDLMDYFPEYATGLGQIQKRLVDPLPIFREWIYDYQFKDSFSLKSVAPAILGQAASYQGLAVGDGGAAQRAYLRIMKLAANDLEKDQIRQNLLHYCKKDTAVLVDLVRWLYKSIEPV